MTDEINSIFKKCKKFLEQINTDIADNNITDPVKKAINKFKNHFSILLILSKVANNSPFSFHEASLSDIEKELNCLIPRKLVLLKIYLQKF